MRTSLAGRAAVALAVSAVAAACVTALAARWLPPPAAALCGCLAVTPFILLGARRLTRPWARVLGAVRDGIVSLHDHDFSVSVGSIQDVELDALVRAYNSLGEVLRRERLDLYQRELLLDTVMQSSPLAMVLNDAGERVIYSNVAARVLLNSGRKLEGLSFPALLAQSPSRAARGLGRRRRHALHHGGGRGDARSITSHSGASSSTRARHQLLLLKQLTRELAAQELAVWTKVIRVIAHELNNSLAPIISLAHSGGLLAQAPQPRAARARVQHHRRARRAPRDLHRRLRTLRQAAAAAAGASGLGGAPRRAWRGRCRSASSGRCRSATAASMPARSSRC